MKKIKLISDFDGIWTNQNIEAEYVWEYILSSLSDLTGSDKEKIQNLLAKCKSEMDKETYKYGWFNNGGMAAYYQEDPFGDNNAIFDYINKSAGRDPELEIIKKSILKKYDSLAEFSQACFMDSTKKFKEEGKLNPVTTMKNIVEELNNSGVEIIVASNSKTEKIKYLFSKAGIEVTDEGSPERGGVHARGDAKKFVIDYEFDLLPEFLKVGENYKIPLRRSSYYEILNEEKPDFVIGDVFSLDIALPLYLRMNNSSFENLKVVQRVQPYTPDWVKDFLNSEKLKGISFMVDNVEELPELIKNIN